MRSEPHLRGHWRVQVVTCFDDGIVVWDLLRVYRLPHPLALLPLLVTTGFLAVTPVSRLDVGITS